MKIRVLLWIAAVLAMMALGCESDRSQPVGEPSAVTHEASVSAAKLSPDEVERWLQEAPGVTEGPASLMEHPPAPMAADLEPSPREAQETWFQRDPSLREHLQPTWWRWEVAWDPWSPQVWHPGLHHSIGVIPTGNWGFWHNGMEYVLREYNCPEPEASREFRIRCPKGTEIWFQVWGKDLSCNWIPSWLDHHHLKDQSGIVVKGVMPDNEPRTLRLPRGITKLHWIEGGQELTIKFSPDEKVMEVPAGPPPTHSEPGLAAPL